MPDISKTKTGWYCFKALPKKEHIAAGLLRRIEGLDSFCPRISYLKKTRRGKVNFVECLFPGYVFVRANLTEYYRLIKSTQGIRDVVSFGDRIPLIPEGFVMDLRQRIGEEQVHSIPSPVPAPGDEVTITEGPFKDLKAVVSGELDSSQRVALLLDFLGRQMEIHLRIDELLPESAPPKDKLWEE